MHHTKENKTRLSQESLQAYQDQLFHTRRSKKINKDQQRSKKFSYKSPENFLCFSPGVPRNQCSPRGFLGTPKEKLFSLWACPKSFEYKLRRSLCEKQDINIKINKINYEKRSEKGKLSKITFAKSVPSFPPHRFPGVFEKCYVPAEKRSKNQDQKFPIGKFRSRDQKNSDLETTPDKPIPARIAKRFSAPVSGRGGASRVPPKQEFLRASAAPG